MISIDEKQALKERIETELRGNILPFWMKYTVDHESGGFYGALTNDRRILNDVPRSLVLCARILWTYSAAYRAYRDEEYLKMAQHAYEYLTTRFWDQEFGGAYWLVDKDGKPVNDRKQSYGQGFAIYGLSEYSMACRDADDPLGAETALKKAQEIFYLLEKHAYDPLYGGYVEARSRNWGPQNDLRLSEKEPNVVKSMNTMLHLVEPYTNLVRAWDTPDSRDALERALTAFIEHIVNAETYTTVLFFQMDWTPILGEKVSFGHDIEASWLLAEAAEVLGDPDLIDETRELAVKMAEAATKGLDPDGSFLYEADREPDGSLKYTVTGKDWWPQAEGMVGFYNAAQILGSGPEAERYAAIALRLWEYIEQKMVDRQHGDWYKHLTREGAPILDEKSLKTGPWDCPYHHARACLEMIRRLT